MFVLRRSKWLILPLFFSALAVGLILPGAVFADGPAVSNPSGKFSVEGGLYDDDESVLALGSYTIPLSHAWGLQVDGALGRIDDDTMGGGGVHLFTRDPDSYLLGFYGSYHEWNDIEIWRSAAEAELYVDRFSLTGLAGFESIDVPAFSDGLEVFNSDSDHFFGHVDLAYYPLDDLKLYGGYRYINETSLGAAGVEYLLRDFGSPMSLFAKGTFGEEEHTRITGGLKIYLGADNSKSLISRHRTEDPQNYTPVFPDIRTSGASSTGNQCTVGSSINILSAQIPSAPTPSSATLQAAMGCTCPAGTNATVTATISSTQNANISFVRTAACQVPKQENA